MHVRVRRLARGDIDAAFAWYSERDQSVAGRFFDDIEEIVTRIAVNPYQFPDVHRGARRALLNHFPYALYFRVEGEAVTVLAVMHHKRSPSLWKRRI